METEICLTCEDVVIMVDVIEFDTLIENVQLICRQHLPFPMSVTLETRGQWSEVTENLKTSLRLTSLQVPANTRNEEFRVLAGYCLWEDSVDR